LSSIKSAVSNQSENDYFFSRFQFIADYIEETF